MSKSKSHASDGEIAATSSIVSNAVGRSGPINYRKLSAAVYVHGAEAKCQAGRATVAGEGKVTKAPSEPWKKLSRVLDLILGDRYLKDILKPILADYAYEADVAERTSGTQSVRMLRFRCLAYILLGTLNWIWQKAGVFVTLLSAFFIIPKCS